MLFDKNHVLIMLTIFLLVIVGEILSYLLVKNESKKKIILRIFAVLTVIIHYSSLYVDFLKTGEAEIESVMLFPIYPCNVAMWLLLIVSFMKEDSKIYKIMSEFTFYLGIVGGIVGILFNEIYANNPRLADYSVLKGFLSHGTLLFGAIYLLVGKFIKIRVHNVLSVLFGMLFLLADGGIIIGIYKLCNLNVPNTMYLLNIPFENLPWINTWTIGVIAVLLTFAITAIYEQFAIKKEDRWYNRLKTKGGNDKWLK